MRELQNLKGEKVEQHQEQNQKQEYKHFGTLRLKSGCKLFAYDSEEDTMTEVKIIAKGVANYTGEAIEERKAQYNPKNVYFQAINEKNAREKYKKYKAGRYELAETFEKKEFLSIKPF